MICAEHARELANDFIEEMEGFDIFIDSVYDDIAAQASHGNFKLVFSKKDFPGCEDLHEIFGDTDMLFELKDNGYNYKFTSKKFKISW